MKSSEKKKCKRRLEGKLTECVEIDAGKKTRTSQTEREFVKNLETDVIDCVKSSRVLRSRSSILDNMDSKTENDKMLKKKEKENNFSGKCKTPKKKYNKSPDDILKNVKLSSNTSNLGQMLSDESSIDEESDNKLLSTPKSSKCRKSLRRSNVPNSLELLSTPKSSKCRKSLRRSYVPDSPGYQNGKSSNLNSEDYSGQRTPSSKVARTPRTPTTPLEKARSSLHVSSVPESLPCREREFKDIFSFLQNKLLDGIGGCMYVSGVPGTGKTATVTQVIKKLKTFAEEGRVPEFKFIEINGMRLSDPRQAYVLLWHGLTGRNEKISPEQAQRKLDGWFSKNDPKNLKKPTLLLVDELDLICTKKQDVVYNLLDWPTKSPSRLIVLTIANTMDMPERLFKGRVTSRLGLTRLTFLPYTFKQLEEIVMKRLTGLEAFTLDAVRLVTRKIAAVSGDARRSLDICRRATELPQPDETVKICHIEQAIREMTNSNSVKIIRSCSEMEKLFLRAVSEVSTRIGTEEIDMRDGIEHFLALCTLEGYPRLPTSHILDVSNRLRCFRLLFSNHPENGIMQRLSLNVTQDDIHYAITCKP